MGRSEATGPRRRINIERGEWTSAPGKRYCQTSPKVSVLIRPVASFSQGGVIFPKQTLEAPQVHTGPYFLNRLKGAPQVYKGSHFSKQTPWGTTSSHWFYNYEKHSHVSKSKLMSDKRSQMFEYDHSQKLYKPLCRVRGRLRDT